MSEYDVVQFAPEHADALALFAQQQPLAWADFASIAALTPAEPRVWIARDGAGAVGAAAIDDGLAMSIGGDAAAIDALALRIPAIDAKLVIAGRTADVRQIVRATTEPRTERIEHFMAIGRSDLSSLIEPVPLRIANEDDLPLLRRARVAALEEEYGIPVPEGSALHEELLNAVGRAVKMQGVAIWVEDEQCAFTAQLIAKTPAAAMFGDLYVDPALRGAGRATKALNAFCAWLMSESEQVTLRVGTENSPAVKLYERVGFRVVDAFSSSLGPTAPGIDE